MLVNIIQNTISSFVSAGISVITTNLKMWLGFETSSIDGDSQITPDKSGNNNVGEFFTGKAIELDGVNDDIRFGSIQIPVKTISFWIKPLSVTNEGLFFLGLSGFPNFRQISITSGNISATSSLTNFTPYVNNVQTSAVTQDVWQRVVLTFDEWTTTSIQIGNIYSSNFGHLVISDVQFYNETWSADDIAYDYANPQKLVTDRSGTSIALSNLKGYWHLSEGAGSLAYDSSGEGNNGTINGATYVDAQPRIPQLGMMNWSKGSNLFSYSQNFSLWNKEATVTLTSNYGTSPSGANDSTRIQMNANDSLYLDNLGSSKTFSIYVKGTQSETIRLSNGVGSLFTLTGNWDRIQLYDTSGASTLYSFNTYSGATARDMEIWGAQLEDSSSASAYRLTDGATTSNSTVIPNPTTPTQDIFGNAVRDRLNSFNLDGSGYAEVADDDDLDFGTGAFTMECWAKADFENTGSGVNIICILGGAYADINTASIATDDEKFRARIGANNLTADVGNNYTIGDWYHICITRDGSNLCTLYIDAQAQVDTETASESITNTSTKLIGRDTLITRFYKNLISDVRLYKGKALTSDEIENNYNAGLSAHTN